MGAYDPTYPLYPVACILSSALLLLILSTSFVRQSWNLGVAFLCFWLFWDNLNLGINAIVWSDNYELKLYVYCDIVSHLQIITVVVRPMCTFIIVRRLYLIVSLCSVELPSRRQKQINTVIEWTLGFIVPLVVAGPLYYVVQPARFEIAGGLGCRNITDGSILSDLLIDSWTLAPPLLSILIHYPKIVWVFYRQHRDINRFLRSNNSVSHTKYFRILALASINIIFILPSSITTVVTDAVSISQSNGGVVPFYSGWNYAHTDWEPVNYPYESVKLKDSASFLHFYLVQWTSPILAFIIFGLFGLTAEARTVYWRAFYFVAARFGWKPTRRKDRHAPVLRSMEFGAPPQEISLDAEMGSSPSFINAGSVIETKPRNIDGIDSAVQKHNAVDNPGHDNSSGGTMMVSDMLQE